MDRPKHPGKDRDVVSRETEPSRLSPVTGKPMQQIVIHGVVVDRCTESGGIWLDTGELERLIQGENENQGERLASWATQLVKTLRKTNTV